ncbi:MAG: hypothetical protein QM803_10030 [Rhodocyclaceae bacterium]
MRNTHTHPVRFEKSSLTSKLFESDVQRFARNRDEALGYHRRATLFARDGMRASLVFNVSAIAIECYMIALCAHFKTMPSNHSFSSLVADVEAVMPLPRATADGIRALDRIFGICSIDDYHHGTPEAADAEQALVLCDALHALLDSLGELADEED